MTPTERWFITSITQLQISGGFTITITTDRPCNLTLFWTDKEPWTHRRGSINRGLAGPWTAYWCGVVWTLIPQDEPGDTTTHTYQWPGWEVCQTKYFRFHGDIAGVTSPSDSAIYRKHYTLPPPPDQYIIPPFDPLQNLTNQRWSAISYESPWAVTPSQIILYLNVSVVVGSDMEVFLEDAYDNGVFWQPFPDQTGHIKTSGVIPAAELNLHVGAHFPYSVTLTPPVPVTIGALYALTDRNPPTHTLHVYNTRGTNSDNDKDTTTWSSVYPYTARDWFRYNPARWRHALTLTK